MKELESVLAAYGIDSSNTLLEVISSGLINSTWKITSGGNQFVLQRVNTNVFREPHKLAKNIRLLADYAAKNYPSYLFVAPIQDKRENELVAEDTNVYRLFPFIEKSHTINFVATPEQAYQAAFQFGKFTNVFSGFDATQLHTTIPNFHNLSFRHQQFKLAVRNGNQQRVADCANEIKQIESYSYLVNQYERILKNPAFKLRVTHHDTKISNVLFDQQDKGICVIDLDTVMPGYFISDVGDMMRTYLSPTTEEDSDYSKIKIRQDFFTALAKGYLDGIGDVLSGEEQKQFLYSGLFLIYMQAIRFLADYFNNDQYYGAKYESHNLIRAKNQLCLLSKLVEQEHDLKKAIGL